MSSFQVVGLTPARTGLDDRDAGYYLRTIFERRARDYWAAGSPRKVQGGIDGLVVHKEAPPHPLQAGVNTLGIVSHRVLPLRWMRTWTSRSVGWPSIWGFLAVDRGESPDFAGNQETGRPSTTSSVTTWSGSPGKDSWGGGLRHGRDLQAGRGEDFDPWYLPVGGTPWERGSTGWSTTSTSRQEMDPGGAGRPTTDPLFPPGPGPILPSRRHRPNWGERSLLWIHGVDVGIGGSRWCWVRKRGWLESMKRVAREGAGGGAGIGSRG